MIRRWARAPSGLRNGTSGGVPGHQVTTGVSGISSGVTTESACSPSAPYIRSSTTSPGPDSPTRISASSRDPASGRRVITASTRIGCSRAASLADRTASYWAASSVTMTSVSTMPLAGPPSRCRACRMASWIRSVVVSARSIIIGGSPFRRAARTRAAHSRLQARPSRAIISSADGGPADPAG